MSDCIFCKIVSKEIPSLVVYEDSEVMAFLDVNPRFEGHTVVIPKKHVETLTDLDDDTAGHLMKVAKRVAEALKEKLCVNAFNLGNNNGEQAGQVVKHLHLHVIPRPESEMKHGFEAAFPVSEDAKKCLQETYGKIGVIDKIDVVSSDVVQEEPKKEEIETPEERWVFTDDDDDDE